MEVLVDSSLEIAVGNENFFGIEEQIIALLIIDIGENDFQVILNFLRFKLNFIFLLQALLALLLVQLRELKDFAHTIVEYFHLEVIHSH